jgi:hypothetical protein
MKKMMNIRWFWRDCNFRNKEWGKESIDSFWVEATLCDAETEIFPLLKNELISQSKDLSQKFKVLADNMGYTYQPYCFLVARNLDSIDPFPVHYPFHQMWNAYSPFETIPEIVISNLKEIRDIDLPLRRLPL